MASADGHSVPKRLALSLISLYQVAFASPLPRCRYLPTCSAYAQEAITTHGVAKGTWLALRRIGRCHPLGGHGYDPVPSGADAPAEKVCVDV